MSGWKSIVSQIDYRKLSFLGRLCNMPNTVHAKGIFNARLSMYICRSDNNQRGFVPDVVQVLEKYELSFELIKYSHSGVFMSYPAWKRTCKQAILKFENAAWNARLHADDDFKRFRQLHTYMQPALLWKCAIDCRISRLHSKQTMDSKLRNQ